MKSTHSPRHFALPPRTLIVSLLLGLSFLLPHAWAEDATIIRIESDGEYAVVYCNVVAGFDYVRLETKDNLTDEDAAWVPRDGVQLDGRGGMFSIRLKARLLANCVRLAVIKNDQAGGMASQGQVEFDGEVTSVNTRNSTDVGLPSVSPPDADATLDASPEGDTAGAEVVDADIWAFNDDRLYIYNRLKGLQIVDVTDPDNTVLLDTLPLPNAGEKMFLLDDEHVLLLAKNGCAYGTDATARGIIVNVANDTAVQASEFPFSGLLQEARKVGDALYLVTHTYKVTVGLNGRRSYNAITTLSSYNLSDRQNPVAVSEYEVDGHVIFIYANPTRAVLGTRVSWYNTQLDLFDISSPTGETIPLSTVSINGYIEDEYKIRIDGDRMITVHESRDPNQSWRNRESVVTSWDITDPTEPLSLDEAIVGTGESLFATRIMEDFAYVVTFLQIDPLWIIDLRDPENLIISGELEVPGFSTFIEPYGDQLITVGREDSRVAVSLFDVGDITNPTLNSRVFLGEGYSTTEANYEEQAFTVLKDQNLIMLPFRDSNGAGLQLIDLFPSGITARGVAYESTAPRRANAHNGRLFSVTGRHLVTLDATDRDNPTATARLTLASPTDRLFKVGDYQVEIDGAYYYWWGQSADTTVRVRDLTSGDIVNEFTTECPLLNATRRGNTLACLAASNTYPDNTLMLKTYDLSSLPDLTPTLLITNTFTDLPNSSLTPHWIDDETLVYEAMENYYYWGPFIDDVAVAPPLEGGARSDVYYPYYDNNKRFLRYNLATGELDGDTQWQAPKNVYDGTTIVGDGTLFVSYTEYENRSATNDVPTNAQDQVDEYLIGYPPEEIFVNIRHYRADRLDLDATNPSTSVVTTFALPMYLRDITPGNLFIVTGSDPDRDWSQSLLGVLRLSGDTLMMLDQISVGKQYGRASFITAGETIYAINRGQSDMLAAYCLDPNDRLQATSFANLEGHVYQIIRFNNLLTATDQNPKFFDITDPKELVPIEMSKPDVHCYYADFNNGDGDSDVFCAPVGDFGFLTFRRVDP